jgi:hypothetical protein
MAALVKSIKQALNPAFLKQKPERKEIELFKREFIALLDRINLKESEEYHKNLIKDFLNSVYYKDKHYINTKGRNDLVIHNDNNTTSSVGVLIEAKGPANKAEMVCHENMNVKSFQELVLYYLRERKAGKNFELRYLIITNIYEWFVFDAQDFERLFYQNKTLINRFEQFQAGKLSGKSTNFFYEEIASPEIQAIQSEIPYTHFDIRDYDQIPRNTDQENDRKLIALYRFLSPVHLLKLSFANDNNQLNKEFYAELLHIIGLEEIKRDNRKLIVRKKANERDSGSIIENAIGAINLMDKLDGIDSEQYGEDKTERLFNVAFDLAITWINRVLFLKLLEAQMIKYNGGNNDFAFLSVNKLNDYGELNGLFFSVLACKEDEREENIKTKFAHVPYLNSSLFEKTEMENKTIFINNLQNNIKIKPYSKTILRDAAPSMRPLEYLLRFLDAYDFSGEGSEDIQEENKTLISASVLGLIFEKINGYKDGSFFTPSFITMYMCRETISRSVIQKFNEAKGWNCKAINDLYNKIDNIAEANEIFNSIRICDPSVGSGHFLVSALNEMIYMKSELGILTDKNGRKLRDYRVFVENDELIVTDNEGNYFTYNPKNAESRRIQETFFHEKQTIIENCLFGADINPNSVKICRLRLWIELLKHTYYRSGTNELETLPNIDINIKCGNSLISRFDLHDKYLGNPALQQKIRMVTKRYKEQVFLYKNMSERQGRKKIVQNIENEKAFFYQLNNAFEWRFEFPEVLDDDGNFVGFDVVIGNPPYMILTKNNSKELSSYNKLFKSLKKGSSKNIFVLFIEKGIQLLRKNARLSFIVPEGLFKTRSYEGCVEIMKKSGFIEFDTTFENFVFENAVTGSLVFAFNNCQSCETKHFHFNKEFKISEIIKIGNLIFEKIETGSISLKDVSTLFKGMVIKDRNTVLSTEFNGHKNIFLFGKNISKWTINSQFYTDYENLEIIGGTKKIEKHSQIPRILIRRTGDTLCCAYLEKSALTESTLYSCYSTSEKVDNKYLFALLNSRLLNYYNKEKNITNQQAFPQILMTDLENLPIKIAANQEQFIALVDKILQAKKDNPQADISETEKEIDILVYELYGLTEEEIDIIEK